jgi:hypothetical protein
MIPRLALSWALDGELFFFRLGQFDPGFGMGTVNNEFVPTPFSGKEVP